MTAGKHRLALVALVIACSALWAFTGAHAAAITVLDTAFSTEEEKNYIGANEVVTWSAGSFGSFSLAGADKLVVTFGTRHSGLPANGPISSVTYNGIAMTLAVGTGVNDSYESAIFYLDDPGTATGDLVATVSRAYGAGATLWALSGTAAGVGATGSAQSSSTSLTTTSANSLVIAHATVAGDPAAPAAQSPLTAGHSFSILYDAPGGRNHSIGTGYQTVASSGTSLTPTFDIGDTTVAAEFTAIPEPGTGLLAVLALAGTVLRRRIRG